MRAEKEEEEEEDRGGQRRTEEEVVRPRWPVGASASRRFRLLVLICWVGASSPPKPLAGAADAPSGRESQQLQCAACWLKTCSGDAPA